jgi:hypothetical protein
LTTTANHDLDVDGDMRWSVLASFVLAGVAACGSSDAPTPDPSSGSPSVSSPSPTVTSTGVQTLTRGGCPVPDDAFCDTATRIGRALVERDAADLLRFSRSTTLDCAEVAREYFPDCSDANDVLHGYGLSGADFLVDMVPRAEYGQRLDEVVAGIDPSFSDELGDGSPSLIGVGTCGPDIPGRRTYHLAWIAALGTDGGGGE